MGDLDEDCGVGAGGERRLEPLGCSREALRMLRGATSGYGWGDAERCGVRGPMGRAGVGWSDCIVSNGEDDGRGLKLATASCSWRRLYLQQRPRGRDHTSGSHIAARWSKMPTSDQPAAEIVALCTPTRSCLGLDCNRLVFSGHRYTTRRSHAASIHIPRTESNCIANRWSLQNDDTFNAETGRPQLRG